MGTLRVTGDFTAPAMVSIVMDRRSAFVGRRDVHKRFDIIDHDAHRDGNAAGRNQFAGDIIYQVIFVARRIVISQQLPRARSSPCSRP